MKRVVNQTRGDNLEMCTFANRKGTLSTIQLYRKFLLYQEDNTRFSVEKKRFELYTIKNESGGKLK